MMIIELVPVPLQILSVKLRKKKLFSFTPIHHAFERKGWPESKVVRVFVAWQAILSLLAIAVGFYGDQGGVPSTKAPVTVNTSVHPFQRGT
jgi:phospho-N-acetylmuramoyl-pentapeptide-transferase